MSTLFVKLLVGGIVTAVLTGAASCTNANSNEPVSAPLGDPGPALEACLRERGWSNATANPDGSIQIQDVPDQQRAQLDADLNECSEKAGLNDLPPRTREQAEALYDALLEAAECVRGLGYQVDDPPSRPAAVEALMQPTIDLGGWDAYLGPRSAARSQQDLNEVYTKCPSPWLKRY